MCVAGGRLPTQRAWPDCLGFRGGPLKIDFCKDEFELDLLTVRHVSRLRAWEGVKPYLWMGSVDGGWLIQHA